MTTETADETPEALRKAARASRRDFARSGPGTFAKAMIAAMEDFARMRADGVSFEDGVRGIESVLREMWPGRPTRFRLCEGCDGTGYRETTCMHGVRCSRYICGIADPTWEHRYVVPCECEKGDSFRPKPQGSTDDALASVGKTKRPTKSWSRMGR